MIDTFKRIAETLGWVGGMLYLIDFVILKWQNAKLQRALRNLPKPRFCMRCTLPIQPGEAWVQCREDNGIAHLSCHATAHFGKTAP